MHFQLSTAAVSFVVGVAAVWPQGKITGLPCCSCCKTRNFCFIGLAFCETGRGRSSTRSSGRSRQVTQAEWVQVCSVLQAAPHFSWGSLLLLLYAFFSSLPLSKEFSITQSAVAHETDLALLQDAQYKKKHSVERKLSCFIKNI